MPMYNLIEYSDNYSDTSGSLWNFKRDEIVDNAEVANDDNAPSFKHKSNLIGNTETDGTKVELSLRWIENCLLTSAAVDVNANNTGADSATFKITDAKLYVPIVTLSAEGNVKLSKLLGEGFKISIYWNEYKVIDNKIVEIATNNEEKYIRELLDSSWQGVKRLFVLAYNNKEGDNKVSVDSYKKYFLPRVKIENYNIEIDGRNFYDQPINDSIKQYDEIRKISTGQGDDYTTGCLLDFAYFEKSYRLI